MPRQPMREIKTNPSPFRYPGSKWKMYPYIRNLIISLYKKPEERENGDCVCYCEPFAGDFSVGFALTLSHAADFALYNDANYGMASAVGVMLEKPEKFIERMYETPVTIEEYEKQKEIYVRYKNKPRDCRFAWQDRWDFGFATFYLNRTNFNGMLVERATPMKNITARFDKDGLAKKIWALSDGYSEFGRVYLCSADVFDDAQADESIFNEDFFKTFKFFYFIDPPYCGSNQRGLYEPGATMEQHAKLAERLKKLNVPFVLTYNDCPEIRELYKDFPVIGTFDFLYSNFNQKKAGGSQRTLASELVISNIDSGKFVWEDDESASEFSESLN